MTKLGNICFKQTEINIWEDFKVLPKKSAGDMADFLKKAFPNESILYTAEDKSHAKRNENYDHKEKEKPVKQLSKYKKYDKNDENDEKRKSVCPTRYKPEEPAKNKKKVNRRTKFKKYDKTWYQSFKLSLKRKEEKEKSYVSSLSEYEKIRLENISERQRIFNELQLGDLASDLSKKKLNVKDEIWKKLCQSTNKKDKFSEPQMIKFFKNISSPKSTPSQIENNVRNVAKMYYLKTEKDFFETFPKIPKVIVDLKNACEPPKQGTKRTRGKNEELFESVDNPELIKSQQYIWKDFCSYVKKTENFKEMEVIEFLKQSISHLKIRASKCDRLKRYKESIAMFYYMETNRKFDVDFPNVQKFVLNETTVYTNEYGIVPKGGKYL